MSHPRRSPEQRVPRSTSFAAFGGVGLVILGVVLSLWQRAGEATQPSIASGGEVDGSILTDLQQIAPTMAGILLAVIAIAFVLLYKSRPHQR